MKNKPQTDPPPSRTVTNALCGLAQRADPFLRSLRFLLRNSRVVLGLKAKRRGQKWFLLSVAQICNLPYRRIAFCRASATANALDFPMRLPIANGRYSRLQICATRPSRTPSRYQKDALREGAKVPDSSTSSRTVSRSAPFPRFSPSHRQAGRAALMSRLCRGTLVASLLLLPGLAPPSLARSALRTPHSTIGNPYLFQGARYDAETGFYYFRNRYYDPRTGRFLQRDPVWDEQNVGGWYTFVANGAISRRDPFGLDDQATLQAKVQEANQKWQRTQAELNRLREQSARSDELERKESDVRSAAREAGKLERELARLKLREAEERQRCPSQPQPPPPPPPPPVSPPTLLPPSPPPPADSGFPWEDPDVRAARIEWEGAVDSFYLVKNDPRSSPQEKWDARVSVELARRKLDEAQKHARGKGEERQGATDQKPPSPRPHAPARDAVPEQRPPTRCEPEKHSPPLSYEFRQCPHCEQEALRQMMFRQSLKR